MKTPPLIFAGLATADEADSATSAVAMGVEREKLAAISARSMEIAALSAGDGLASDVTWELIETPTTVIIDANYLAEKPKEFSRTFKTLGRSMEGYRIFMPIFGNHYISLPARHKLQVELELQIRGDHPVSLVHRLRGVPRQRMPSTEEYSEAAVTNSEFHGLKGETLGFRPRFVDRTIELAHTERAIQPDAPFKLVYTFVANQDFERINASMSALNEHTGIAGVIIRKAVLSISGLEDEEKVTGLTILEYSHAQDQVSEVAKNP